MKRDLPKRMYRHGQSYRLHLPNGEKINLGRDLRSAMVRYHECYVRPDGIDIEEAAQEMWKRQRKGAAQRRIPFELQPADVLALLRKQRGRCALTGLAFRNDKPPQLRIRPWAPSIDRLDSSKGYLAGNVRIVCAFVNVAMNGFGEHYFRLVLEPLMGITNSRAVPTNEENQELSDSRALLGISPVEQHLSA